MPAAVYGYFAANGDGDDIVIWKDETRTTERTRFPFPRQTKEPFLCIADFFRPVDSPRSTTSPSTSSRWAPAVSERTAELFAANKYQDYLLLHGLGVEMAEALAEYWHRRIREEWGFADEDGPTLAGLFRQQYRGGRYSWGYPACPDLEDNAQVRRAARRRAHRHRVQRGDRLPVPARADDLGHHLPPPAGQVLRRPLRGMPRGDARERHRAAGAHLTTILARPAKTDPKASVARMTQPVGRWSFGSGSRCSRRSCGSSAPGCETRSGAGSRRTTAPPCRSRPSRCSRTTRR